MALSSQQYQSIMERYEQLRKESRLELEARREKVYQAIPEYRELELSVGSTAVDRLHSLLNGDETALASMHTHVEEVRRRKKALLRQAGFPDDYLEPIYHCPQCKDTGYIETENHFREKCHCLLQQELQLEIPALYEQSNLQNVLSRENFSTLSYAYYEGEDLEHFQGAVEISKNFIENFVKDYQNILFCGTVGTGKSFLSNCIANELLKKGRSVIYFSSIGLFDLLARYNFDSREKGNLSKLYENLYDCDLLIIDDLGTEVTNAFVASELFSCLNERHIRRKATIISTNLNLKELSSRYSDRVLSRITGNFTLCKITGPDIRMCRRRKQPNYE